MAKFKPTFSEIFTDRLRAIEENANLVGINMTIVCKEAGIGRATPDRWKRVVPTTVQLIDQMEEVVEKHRKRKLEELSRLG